MLDDSIKSAKEGNSTSLAPIHTGGRKSRVRQYEMPDITHQVARIHDECDPVGFLMDVVAGTAIQTHLVITDENGDREVVSSFETPDMKQRIDAAKYLAERVVPKQSVHKHAHLHKSDSDGDWEQMVKHASNKST